MFFEEDDDKDTSRNMDDHDLDFEGEDSVSWDKLLEETDAQQPEEVTGQIPDDLLLGDNQPFDNLADEQSLGVNAGAAEEYLQDLEVDAPTDEYAFDLLTEEPASAQSFAQEPEYENPAFEQPSDAFEEQQETSQAEPVQYFEPLEHQAATTHQTEQPDEEYDAQSYDYDEITTGSQGPQQPQPEKGIPAASLMEGDSKGAPKKNNAILLGILIAAAAVTVVVAVLLFGKDFIPGFAGASTGDADDLLNADIPVAQDIDANGAAVPSDDPMAPPTDGQDPAASAPAQQVTADNAEAAGGAPIQPGVSKKVEDKGAAKDPKTAKAEPGRGKVLLPVVNTGRPNPFTPLVKYNTLGFIAKPNLPIPEPMTELGNLTDVLDKLQQITVSGILYDSIKPSAIIKVSNVDYFVQKGDKVDGYVVADITQTTVTIKDGGNTYRASIGQAFSGTEALKGQVSAGGKATPRQYVSDKDTGISPTGR